jgi:hypothetical protein
MECDEPTDYINPEHWIGTAEAKDRDANGSRKKNNPITLSDSGTVSCKLRLRCARGVRKKDVIFAMMRPMAIQTNSPKPRLIILQTAFTNPVCSLTFKINPC